MIGLVVKPMALWKFAEHGARAEIVQECHQFPDRDPAEVLTWFAYLVGQAEQKSTLPKSRYVHCGLGKIHSNGGLTLPPSPEQQRRIKRAREAPDEMGRLDRVPRVEGRRIWFDHRDPANPCSRRKPAWLDPDILEYKPEILAILKAQNGRTAP